MQAPRIHVLPPALADQIAAGEVVERPASVVKELVENALDAGAGRIEVDIASGGAALVRVSDDGSGMTPEEAHLALKRHATSKLHHLDELLDLRTMGFRGEALPSIAAVSRMSLTTRTADSVEGYRLVVEGGHEVEGRAAGCPRGTQIEVRELFFNVPARQKFQKAQATETAHVVDTMVRLALAHPEVHFRLRVDGAKPVLDTPPHRSLLERATAALSRRGAVHLHLARGQENGIEVTACLGAPAESGNTTRNTFLFVNRRFVKDRGLLQALALGYGELLDRGRYPLAVVQVTPALGTVDVNVHPQKTEVRFQKPQEVFAAVRHVVRAACARAPWLAEPVGMRVYQLPPEPSLPARDRLRDDSRMNEALALFAPRGSIDPSAPGGAPAGNARLGGAVAATGAVGFGEAGDASPLDSAGQSSHPRAEGSWTETAASPGLVGIGDSWPGGKSDGHGEGTRAAGGFFASLRYLGQAHKTYLVCEAAGELVLIDQHAAHERVAFERLKLAHQSHTVRTQRLLFPHTLELDEGRAAAVADHASVLESLGFEIEPLSGRSHAVRAVPQALAEAPIGDILFDMLDELGQRGASEVLAERLDHLFATMACHSVVRAGDVLDERRVRALLDSMDGIDFRAHCPHGRPVLLRMSVGELERRFGRS